MRHQKVFGFLLIFSVLFAGTTIEVVADQGWEISADLVTSPKGVDDIITGAITDEQEMTSYCVNISDAAKEARTAILMKRLTETEAQVEAKLNELNSRISVLKNWIEQREKFLAKVDDSLVQIFQTMRADAAAQQFTEMGPAMSAAIISKLDPKYSSAIMTEMKPNAAAKIAMILTNMKEGG